MRLVVGHLGLDAGRAGCGSVRRALRFKNDLVRDPLASRRVEVAVVAFDSEVKVLQEFVTADQFQPPTLTAQGLTHMGEAIIGALDAVHAAKRSIARTVWHTIAPGYS